MAVGCSALAGVAAETCVIMLIYLAHDWEAVKTKCRAGGREPGVGDLYEAVMEGAVERVRPKMMTVVAIMAGLLPILWGTGTGSEVMSRIAAPMVGGMIASTVLTLAVIPAVYALVKQWRLNRGIEGTGMQARGGGRMGAGAGRCWCQPDGDQESRAGCRALLMRQFKCGGQGVCRGRRAAEFAGLDQSEIHR